MHLWPKFGDPSLNGDVLSRGQAQNGVNFDFEVKFYIEGQSQSPPKTTGILTKVFYTYGPNLVILAWMGDELSCGQASDYRTHGRTDTQTQPTTIPEEKCNVKARILYDLPYSSLWRECIYFHKANNVLTDSIG